MKRSLLEYDLPKESIAQHPRSRRDGSRLLHLPRGGGDPVHGRFRDLPGLLREGDLLVLNDTAVRQARLLGRRETGGKVEVLLLRREGEAWMALTKCRGRLRAGERLIFEGAEARVEGPAGAGEWRVTLDVSEEILQRLGEPPLPPYIRRPEGPDERDRHRYQTVYASAVGSVAAPTAGLHFTRPLIRRLRRKGVEILPLALHIGPGTFRPIRADDVEDHRMDSEPYRIPPETVMGIDRARREGRRVIAVGTSTTRALETYSRTGNRSGDADLFIHPPFDFRIVDGLITNFHLPGSTLIALVAAMVGRERILETYEDAARAGYRFYSYGDAMLIL